MRMANAAKAIMPRGLPTNGGTGRQCRAKLKGFMHYFQNEIGALNVDNAPIWPKASLFKQPEDFLRGGGG